LTDVRKALLEGTPRVAADGKEQARKRKAKRRSSLMKVFDSLRNKLAGPGIAPEEAIPPLHLRHSSHSLSFTHTHSLSQTAAEGDEAPSTTTTENVLLLLQHPQEKSLQEERPGRSHLSSAESSKAPVSSYPCFSQLLARAHSPPPFSSPCSCSVRSRAMRALQRAVHCQR
jgi:hypothetical protein